MATATDQISGTITPFQLFDCQKEFLLEFQGSYTIFRRETMLDHSILSMAALHQRATEIRQAQQNRDQRENATYDWEARDSYPVGTSVRLVNGELGWITQVGKKTMVKLKKSGQVRQAKDGYSVASGLFRNTN